MKLRQSGSLSQSTSGYVLWQTEKCRIRPMAYTDLINNAFEEISQRGKICFALFTVFKRLIKAINIME